jgi:hypothetical protein
VRLYRQEHPAAGVFEVIKIFHQNWEAFLNIEEERETATEH